MGSGIKAYFDAWIEDHKSGIRDQMEKQGSGIKIKKKIGLKNQKIVNDPGINESEIIYHVMSLIVFLLHVCKRTLWLCFHESGF